MLAPRNTPEAQVNATETGWHLEIPAGPADTYRLAQLDDYAALPRQRFPLRPPATLSLRARVSASALPGTWGFGFWNDPFTVSLGLQGMARRLPVLPNAVWFFHASAENHLSFHDHLPGSGFLAQTFRAPKIPSLLLAPGMLALPALFSRTLACLLLRPVLGTLIREDSLRLDVDESQWHEYRLEWRANGVRFSVDDVRAFESVVSPRGPLGLVIWLDNQYAAFSPDGKIGAGALPTPAAGWLEIERFSVLG
jgi:hypothetical protein